MKKCNPLTSKELEKSLKEVYNPDKKFTPMKGTYEYEWDIVTDESEFTQS